MFNFMTYFYSHEKWIVKKELYKTISINHGNGHYQSACHFRRSA